MEGLNVGPSKSRQKKQIQISLDENLGISKGNDLDNSLQYSEPISANKNEVRDSPLGGDLTLSSPVKGNLETVSGTVENHAGLSGMKKKIKKRKKLSNSLENMEASKVGPSKSREKKQIQVSLDKNLGISKGNDLDNSLQYSEPITEEKNEVRESPLGRDLTLSSPVKGNLETVSGTVENYAELSGTKKIKKRKKLYNSLEKNQPEQNLVEEKWESDGKISTTSRNTKTVSKVKHKVDDTTSCKVQNLEFPANESLGIASLTPDEHAEDCALHINRIRRRKRRIVQENKNPSETDSLCVSDLTNNKPGSTVSEISELALLKNEKIQEVPLDNNLTGVQSRSLSECEKTNPMNKHDLSAETDMPSNDVKILKTYQRKDKKVCSLGKSLESSKDEGCSTSLQVVQQSLEGEVSVKCPNAVTFFKAKGKTKLKNAKDENELNAIQKVIPKFGYSEIEILGKSQKISSENNSERLKKARPVSSQVMQNSSPERVSFTCTVVHNTHQDKKTLQNVSRHDLWDDQFTAEKKGDSSKVQKTVQEREFSVEVYMGESPPDCIEDNSLSPLESRDVVDRACSHTLEVVTEQDKSLELCKKGFSTSSQIGEIVSLGESSANCSKKRSVSKKRERKDKVKHTLHEGKSSDYMPTCGPSAKQPDCVFAEGNIEASLNECQVESIAPSNRDVINDAVIAGAIIKEDNYLKASPKSASELCKEGCRTSSQIGEIFSQGESSANYSNKRSVLKKRVRKDKVTHTLNEGKASDMLTCGPYAKQPNVVLAEGNMEASLNVCPKEGITPSNRDVINDAVMVGDMIKEDKASPERASELCKEGCSTSLQNGKMCSLDESSANCLNKRSVSKKKVRKDDVKHTSHEGTTSDDLPAFSCSAKQPGSDDMPTCLFAERDIKAFLNECQMEAITPSNRNALNNAVTVGAMIKEDNLLKVLERSSICHTGKKLLILDLNGLLVDIVLYFPVGFKADKKVGKKFLFKRPFYDDFLKFCFERFNVGVWSSRAKINVDNVVDFIMSDMKHKLLFCWDQSHCTRTAFSTVENSSKPLVLKELKKLWDKRDSNLPWEKGEYNESNTLLLDDSPYKALRNPPHTAIFPNSYQFHNANDNSLGPGGDIRMYLERLATAENVQKYIEQHPFGQRPITSKNPSWAYYLKVLSTGKSCLPTRR